MELIPIFIGNPLSGLDRDKRELWAYRDIDSHTIEQKKQIYFFCKAKIEELKADNPEGEYSATGAFNGRIYLGDGKFQSYGFIEELPFLEFDRFTYTFRGCEIYIFKMFDGGIGYYIGNNGEDETFEMFTFDSPHEDSYKKVDFD